MSPPAADPPGEPDRGERLPDGEDDGQEHQPLGGLAVQDEQDRGEARGDPAGEEVARAIARAAGEGEQEGRHRVLAVEAGATPRSAPLAIVPTSIASPDTACVHRTRGQSLGRSRSTRQRVEEPVGPGHAAVRVRQTAAGRVPLRMALVAGVEHQVFWQATRRQRPPSLAMT